MIRKGGAKGFLSRGSKERQTATKKFFSNEGEGELVERPVMHKEGKGKRSKKKPIEIWCRYVRNKVKTNHWVNPVRKGGRRGGESIRQKGEGSGQWARVHTEKIRKWGGTSLERKGA